MKLKFDLNKICAVLFDFDGVLMRSIEDHHRSWNEVFRTYGVEIGWEEFCLLEGQSLYTIAGQLCRQHGIDDSKAELIGRAKNDIYLNTSKPALYDDVISLLDTVKNKRMKIALVTGAHRDRFERSVESGFLSYFGAVVTADDVTRTKPDPEPFLTAAKKLEVPNEQCVVIENAPLGIASAKSAGMPCIALTTTLTESHLSGADMILNNLKELRTLFLEISL